MPSQRTEVDAAASSANKDAVKRLKAAIELKRTSDKKLANIEAAIANFEGSYLQETALSGGNIIKGFDQYMKQAPNPRRKAEIQDHDRLFSLSSGSYLESLNLLANEKIEQARIDAEYQQLVLSRTQAAHRNDRQGSESTNGGGGAGGGGGGNKKRKREENLEIVTGNSSRKKGGAGRGDD